MKNWFAIVVLVFSVTTAVSQTKYIVVPQRIGDFKGNNPYGITELLSSYFKTKGFEVILDDAVLPNDLAKDKCKALYADLLSNSGVFTTKVSLELRNCKNEVVALSNEGTSREKDMIKSHHLAFREAVSGFDLSAVMDYFTTSSIFRSSSTEVLEKERPSEVTPTIPMDSHSVLYAQPIDNGFQLVDATPKVVLKIFKTSLVDYFIAQAEGKNGVLLKKNGHWFFEYTQNGQLVSELLQIRF